MNFTDIRLKLRHWFRKYKSIIFLVVIIWGVIFIINRFLISYDRVEIPTTTRQPDVTVMDSNEKAPSVVQQTAEKMIKEYVGYCNEGNYQKAFNMLSEDCQRYAFYNDIEEFAKYVLVKIPNPREYSIQDYSNYGKYYVYEVKYIDDILSTGLTDQIYSYSTEKIVFTKNSKGGYDMATGNFISHDMINNVAENEYVKIDIKERTTKYSLEIYEVKFTNRTDSTVVIQDNIENGEVNLVLSGEYRSLDNPDDTIILEPNGEKTAVLAFNKFADDGDDSQGILFSSIRVIENYKGMNGTEDERKEEIDNALAKFSMQVPIN